MPFLHVPPVYVVQTPAAVSVLSGQVWSVAAQLPLVMSCLGS